MRIAHLADLDSLADMVAELRSGSANVERVGADSPVSQLLPTAKKKDELNRGQIPEPLNNTGRGLPPQSAGETVDFHSPSGDNDSPAATVNEPHFKKGMVADVPTIGGDVLTSLEDARRIWEAALATVENLTADHARAASEIAIRAPNQLAVVFAAKYNFSKTFCERPDRAAMLEEALASVARRPIRLVFELRPEAVAAANGGPRRVVSPRQRKAELEIEICRRPLVERAVALFGATVDVLEKSVCSKDLET